MLADSKQPSPPHGWKNKMHPSTRLCFYTNKNSQKNKTTLTFLESPPWEWMVFSVWERVPAEQNAFCAILYLGTGIHETRTRYFKSQGVQKC